MVKPVNIGAESFHELIESNSYYVDKTPFIRTVFQEITSKVLLITRPRRFGKTLTMSTFLDFLAINPDNPEDLSRQKLWFKDTAIFSDREFCRRYMGRFPVIFMSLKSVYGSDFDKAYQQLGSTVYKMMFPFRYLADSSKLSKDDIGYFQKLQNKEFLCDQKHQNNLVDSLEQLCCWLWMHHGVKPVVLIDEYDVPIAKAAERGYYREMVDVIGLFLGNALKTNNYLGRGILTGCLRAAKESIFTGLNNFQNCSILDSENDQLSRAIGFTEEETNEVLSYYGLDKYRNEVKNNYGGYNFGTAHMYCPWNVMNFCDDNYELVAQSDELVTADNYWINTSGNAAIEDFMGYIKSGDVDLMQELLDGKSITATVKESLCYGDLQNHDLNDFWTLLLYTGYLTFDPSETVRKENQTLYQLYIPNQEIRKCFESKILDFFRNNPAMKNHTEDLIRNMFAGDEAEVQLHLNRLLEKYVSIRDFATSAPKENYYHGFMNGLLLNGCSLIQEQKSNFESGNGYIDLLLLSASRDSIIILELKRTDDKVADTRNIALEAINQIINTRYADVYLENETITSIYAYGICFYKRSCSVAVQKLK
ncbi:MAG: AAA family ATPase [Succinivibrionaceae bacterium]|nr:AAA family ATPase [Succinivibrionaceae bacterium]